MLCVNRRQAKFPSTESGLSAALNDVRESVFI